jgi:hypothetical protein
VLRWALANGFEYVEPEEDDGIDEGGGMGTGSAGFARAVDALQAHMWPGMRLKSEQRGGGGGGGGSMRSADLRAEVEEEDTDAAVAAAVSVATGVPLARGQLPMGPLDGASPGFDINGLLGAMEVLTRDPGDDQTTDDDLEAGDSAFVLMLEQMRLMKEQAKSLPDEQRKEYAEKVAMQFYQSLCAGYDDEAGEEEDEN